MTRIAVSLVALMILLPRGIAMSGDADAGKTAFNRSCAGCHSIVGGRNGIGPSLAGIFGRKAGSEPGFNYSAALRDSNIVWDAGALDAYMTDAAKFLPGTKKTLRIADADMRQTIIRYLEQDR
jgi:cytochrome c